MSILERFWPFLAFAVAWVLIFGLLRKRGVVG